MARGGLFFLSLRLAEAQGLVPAGTCAALAKLPDRALAQAAVEVGQALSARTGGVLPLAMDELELYLSLLHPLDAGLESYQPPFTPCLAPPDLGDFPEGRKTLEAPAPELEALCTAFERGHVGELPKGARRQTGVYYTPKETAAHVVELGLTQGSVRAEEPGLRVFDPCAGAGLMLMAAARRLMAVRGPEAVGACTGSDIDPAALKVARAALLLLGAPTPTPTPTQTQTPTPTPTQPPHASPAPRFLHADALREAPAQPIDLLVTNPPYGHLESRAERAFLAQALPGLRGAEVDRYAAFLLRSLALVRPGGTAALLVPDTWMTNLRSGPLRRALLDQAELAAVADLGKPFASARDTRVQAAVWVRRHHTLTRLSKKKVAEVEALTAAHPPRETYVARAQAGTLVPLCALSEDTLRAHLDSGWQPYRTRGEQALCDALERASLPLHEVCEVGYGLRTGNNATHVARREPGPGEVALCGGEDIEPFALRWHPKTLVALDATLVSLTQKQLGRARIAVQRIRTNKAAPHARWLEAALIGPELVGLDSLSTLAIPEGTPDAEGLLLALLGLFGSVALERVHRLRTTDVNVKPSALRELPVPKGLLDPQARAPLVALVRQRIRQRDHLLDRQIDRTVYDLFGLDDSTVREAEQGFWGDRFHAEFQQLAAPQPRPPEGNVRPPL